MELANNGSLQRLLRQHRRRPGHAHNDDVIVNHAHNNDSDVSDVTSHRHRLTSSDLVLLAVHVANGMEYVASQQVSNNNNKKKRISVLVQRFNTVLLHDSLPAADCTD